MANPAVFGLWLGLDQLLLLSAHVRQQLGDPFNMLLDGDNHIGQDRRAAWAGDHEKVREVGHHKAQVGTWPCGPLLFEQALLAASNLHALDGAGNSVKARGKHHRVQRIVAAGSLQTCGVEALNGRGLQVVQLHMRQVEGGVVVGVNAQALGSQRVTLGA